MPHNESLERKKISFLLIIVKNEGIENQKNISAMFQKLK
jgi:hypothetical protein